MTNDRSLAVAMTVVLGLAACGDEEASAPAVPTTYQFESGFSAGESSVAYGEEVTRHLLADAVATTLEELTAQIDSGAVTPAEDVIVASLDRYYGTDASGRAAAPILLTTTPSSSQLTFADLPATSLADHMAGSDPATDFRDFSTGLVGWSDATLAMHGGDITSPGGLMRAIFETVEANAIARASGTMRPDPVSETGELPVEVTDSGVNLAELTQQLLLTGVAYHQAADRYLDDEPADVGSGLYADNVAAVAGSPYTALEHEWDQAWGCFGAARDYGTFAVGDLVDGSPYQDSDSNGSIDLTTEHSFKPAVYLARRDDGSAASAPTSFAARADLAFRTGRSLIVAARGHALTAAERDALRAQRDLILGAWERGIAASIVHYLNGVLLQMELAGTSGYEFGEHTGEWSEMKMFAVGLQFNPHSPILGRLVELHGLLRDAPVLPTPSATPAELDAYADDLRAARALLGGVYGFNAANLGAEDGTGGW